MSDYLAIIDANISRVKEGLRVLEDIARFILKDPTLFESARALRHSLKITKPARAAGDDPGDASFEEDNQRPNLVAVVHANALRVQEGLRVLEEFTEDKAHMKSLRHKVYDLHQALFDQVSKLSP